jgi:hypothetical protein
MQMGLRFIEENDRPLLDEANHVGGHSNDESLTSTQPLKEVVAIALSGNEVASCFLAKESNDEVA